VTATPTFSIKKLLIFKGFFYVNSKKSGGIITRGVTAPPDPAKAGLKFKRLGFLFLKNTINVEVVSRGA